MLSRRQGTAACSTDPGFLGGDHTYQGMSQESVQAGGWWGGKLVESFRVRENLIGFA